MGMQRASSWYRCAHWCQRSSAAWRLPPSQGREGPGTAGSSSSSDPRRRATCPCACQRGNQWIGIGRCSQLLWHAAAAYATGEPSRLADQTGIEWAVWPAISARCQLCMARSLAPRSPLTRKRNHIWIPCRSLIGSLIKKLTRTNSRGRLQQGQFRREKILGFLMKPG